VEQYFTSLSKRQTMLLLTSIAFGGADALAAFEHLDPDEAELLKYRANALLQIPREKRVPMLAQEIKRLVTQRRRQLASAEPKRLSELLQLERASVLEVVLNALPGDLAAAVRIELGQPPPFKLGREVKPEVLAVIRWKLEEALRWASPQVGGFRFTDLMTMQQRDIFAVADRMGARVLATAVAGLLETERADFLAKLPPDQRVLASRAAEQGLARKLNERDAKLVLEMHGALEDPSVGMRSAGVQRIVRACLAQGADFAQRFVTRYQGDFGKVLARWLKEEKPKAIKGDGGRMDIVEQLERLAQKGIVDRPMRLPPPAKAPLPVLRPPPGVPLGGSQSKVLVAPPRLVSAGGSVSAAPHPHPRPSLAPSAARRDPLAERAARRAGIPLGPAAPSESQVRGQKVLRDGKPLERKRKDVATNPRSKVLKGSDRGPKGGSS
jgi:hypothetical protein